MTILDHEQQPFEEWRPGVRTRMRVSALNGAGQLCVFEQFCDPGKGAPTHLHTVEEVLTVIGGTVDIWVEDRHVTLTTGQSLIVPPGQKHGFRNVGGTVLHVQAILAAPIFEACFDDRAETQRRWCLDESVTGS
jgi:quercetin dioxygenase-like cupin family protein